MHENLRARRKFFLQISLRMFLAIFRNKPGVSISSGSKVTVKTGSKPQKIYKNLNFYAKTMSNSSKFVKTPGEFKNINFMGLTIIPEK